MLYIINLLRPYLELAYFFSGTVLVISVIIGVWQVRIMKKDIETTNRRMEVEKTIEYMDRFSQKVIPLYKNY